MHIAIPAEFEIPGIDSDIVAVGNLESPILVIMARDPEAPGGWQPLFGVRRSDKTQVALPPCFVPSLDVIIAANSVDFDAPA